MKKHVFGRKLKRDTNERKALFKNLLTSLVLNEQIKTSEAKAKAIKAAADKLITKAKKGGQEAVRALEADVNHNAVVKLVEDLGARFASRNGGYTRIIKMGNRVADNSPEAVIEWVEKKSGELKVESGKVKTERKEVTKTKKSVQPAQNKEEKEIVEAEIVSEEKKVVKKTKKETKSKK